MMTLGLSSARTGGKDIENMNKGSMSNNSFFGTTQIVLSERSPNARAAAVEASRKRNMTS